MDTLDIVLCSRNNEFEDDEEYDYNEEELKNDRREFVGRVARKEIRDKYIHKSVEQFYGNGKRNPIRYI